MSRVFLAREPALARDVVVKVLPPDLVSASSLQRFTREIRVTAGLQHPHILPVITAGGTDDLRFYVTPFIRGESLKNRLRSGDPMALADALRAADEMLNAVVFAHARGVIHRDIKPGNILLSEGHAILADFGIAAIAEAEHPADHTDHVTGSTLDSAEIYVAPERPRDEQRDLFAAAVVIHEMAVGAPGTAGLTAATITAALRARHPAAAPAQLKALGETLARGLAVDPAKRYRSAAELRTAIRWSSGGSRRQLMAGIGVGIAAAILALTTYGLSTDGAATPQLQLPPTPSTVSPADTTLPGPQQGLPAAPSPSAPRAPTPAPTPAMSSLDSAGFMFRRGRLGDAASLYQQAAAENPSDSRAQLGLAITAGAINTPADGEVSRIAADRALRGSPALDAHDKAVAEGFIALADHRYPEACEAFNRARAERPTFAAFFGAGECRMRNDRVVLGADGVPVFQAGYATAFDAYVSAARAAAPSPPAIVYRRMQQAVPQSGSQIRLGRSDEGRSFVGNWRILGDTLGFLVSPSGPRQMSAEQLTATEEAARLGQDKLRPLLLSWVRQMPDEPMAHEALSMLLENSGAIDEMGDARVSALHAIEAARRLERDSVNALRLANSHARLLLRAQRYGAFAALADTILTTYSGTGFGEADALLPIALVSGRVSRAAEILARISGVGSRGARATDGRPVQLSPAVVAERADFQVRASLGVCDARVRSGPQRMIELLDAAFPGGVPPGVESSFMERSVLLALPCVGPSVAKTMREPSRLVSPWIRAFDPADTAFPAEFQARIRARTQPTGPNISMDGIVIDALARLAIGDTVSALKLLTLQLDRLALMHRGAFTTEHSVGSMVRAMVVAADLAMATGDRATAHRWSSAIVALWRKADPELQPQVERMRAIAKATSDGPGRE